MNSRLRPGRGGLLVLPLASSDGARGEVYLHGAHLTSWLPAGEAEDRLFVSGCSPFAAGAPIRGGVPVAFPQFADQGPLRPHGFARTAAWTLVEDGVPQPSVARLRLEASDGTLGEWPHPFRLELRVEITGRRLRLALAVENAGDMPFTFTGALHTYLRVRDIGRVVIRGLAGARYRDKVSRDDNVLQMDQVIAITGETDRVYRAAPERVLVEEPGRYVAIEATGFPDTVIWNPGPTRAAAMNDMEPDGYMRMVCVEAAVASSALMLEPGRAWHGTQTLVAG